ncbi:Flp pilus assembly complex ATPase component TadA [Candidatus Saccharibacteria bacterium]|nr:Flp pilus assembly complex ATPase component TadA [Candidatus Saccharibacteria bacterium]MBR3157367.1 Flp pilus assembly complex ATPase component TadA [Candidatus Saccharibacteria bacterium]
MDESEIQQKRRDNEEEATAGRAKILGMPYLDTRSFENEINLVPDLLEVEQMHRDFIIPLQRGGGEEHYQFMVTSQTPRSVIEKMSQEYTDEGEKADFFLISGSAYKVFMLRYDPPKVIEYDDIKIAGEGDSETIASVSQTLNMVSTDKVFDFLIDQADKLGASDIHIENMRGEIRIRMRVDGILHPVANIDKDRYRIFMGELSSRANVSMASNKPQSGHMQKDIHRDGASHLLNIRVETIPTMYGQDAVLRLFNFDESLLNLDLLGLSDEERAEINEVISHPRGLVLMVGPTGSGKSTTLYSMLNALNTTDRKIITLEDPIEYGITGISQIPIHTNDGGSFAEGLRSVLRLDPDVVMVGEIRDADTAKTAIQASITGHLVLSSFHANSTSAAFSRMIDLIGVNPIFSSSIRLVVAQRLVRKLSDSKKERPATEAEAKYIREALADVPSEKLEGVNLDNIMLYDPMPTENDPFGYSGRTVIMEQLIVSESIQAFIRGDVADADATVIEAAAKKNGLLTLEQKGLLATLRGETTLEEVSRVI